MLNSTKRYPTLYVFGRKPLNFEDFKANITGIESEHILITYDVQYAHFSGYFDTCHEEHNHIIFTKLLNTVDTVDNNNDHYFNHSGRAAVLSAHISEYTLVHIGTESNFLTGLIMTHSKNPIYSYNPETQEYRRENAHVNKSLNRRFFMVEKAKDCEMFGVLVGTLSVSQYMDSISRIKKIIQDAGKSFYTFVVGKINVEKLANFAEIEMFVLVACPENSLIDSKDFLQPIITPFELEIALVPGKGWTGDYSVDFTSFLNSPLPSVEAEEEDTRISLVSNVVKKTHKVIEVKGPDSETGTVALRQEMGIESYEKANASKYFLQRTFQGLQMSMEELEPMVAIDGKIGTARGYRDLEEEKQK